MILKRKYLFLTLSFLFVTYVFLFNINTYGAISIENGLSHQFKVSPGNSYDGEIIISNYSEYDKYVKVFQRDYLFNYKGESFYLKPDSINRSNAGWIDVNATYFKIPANEQYKLRYQINVPDDSLLTGSYWSVIMVEGVSQPDTSDKTPGLKIQTVIRYAIQIITDIEETGVRKLEFMDVFLQKEDSIFYLQVDMQNVGERFLKPALKLELFDNEGNSVGVFESTPRKIYPGTSVRVKVVMNDVKPGKYQALLVADTGEDEVFGMNISLEIDDG